MEQIGWELLPFILLYWNIVYESKERNNKYLWENIRRKITLKENLFSFIFFHVILRSKTVSNCWPWLLPPPHVCVLSPWWNSSWELKQPRPCGGCLFLTNTLIGRAGLPLMFQVHDFDSTFTRFDIRHYVSLFVEHTIMTIFIRFLAVIFLIFMFFSFAMIFIYDDRNTFDTKMLIKEVSKLPDSHSPGSFRVSELFANMSILLSGSSSLCAKFHEQYKH